MRRGDITHAAMAAIPATAVCATARDGLVMGLVAALALWLAAALLRIVRGILRDEDRLPVAMIVGAALVAAARMALAARLPEVSRSLGAFLPMTAMGALALCVEERPAEGGLACLGVMTLLGAACELIGGGSLFGAAILPAGVPLASQPAGGLLLLGVGLSLVNRREAA